MMSDSTNTASGQTANAGPWTIFWSFFLATVLLLGGVHVFLRYTAGPDLQIAEDGQLYASKSVMDALERELPTLVGLMDVEFGVAAENTEALIDQEVDALFERAYAAVPSYLRQHYTVRGEYTELFTATIASQFQDRTESLFEKVLFTETDFADAQTDSLARVQAFSDGKVDVVLGKVSDKLSKELELDRDEMSALSQVATLTLEDTRTRITDTAVYRGVAVTAGAVMVIRLISRRVAAKAIVKGGTKTAAKATGSVIGGAGAGATGGLICGPGAPICSAVGGVAGGVIAWFAMDKIIVEVDEALNRDKFQAEIIAILDQEKESMKEELKAFYRARYDAIEAHNTQTLENVRLRDQIGPLTPMVDAIETFPDRIRRSLGE